MSDIGPDTLPSKQYGFTISGWNENNRFAAEADYDIREGNIKVCARCYLPANESFNVKTRELRWICGWGSCRDCFKSNFVWIRVEDRIDGVDGQNTDIHPKDCECGRCRRGEW